MKRERVSGSLFISVLILVTHALITDRQAYERERQTDREADRERERESKRGERDGDGGTVTDTNTHNAHIRLGE